MENTIQIERPWYALAPVFLSMAKQKTFAKFEAAKDKLMTRVSTVLE